jgi:nitroreductase
MRVSTAVKKRRSVRKFLSKPVSEKMICEIIDEALWAPSWGNTQPWEIVVLTGEILENYKKANAEALASGQEIRPDVPMPTNWPEILKNRYKHTGKKVLQTLGIEREDTAGRINYYLKMHALFDAPALVLFLVDESVSIEYAMLDIGIVLQTFCLLAVGKGLGTCIMAASVNYGAIAHQLLAIPDTKKIVIGTALGWPDEDADINRFDGQRGDINEFVTWIR